MLENEWASVKTLPVWSRSRSAKHKLIFISVLFSTLIFLFYLFPEPVAQHALSTEDTSEDRFQSPPPPPADRPVAIMLDSKPIANTLPTILHFASVLGPSWSTILFTLKEHWNEPLPAALQRLRDAGQFEVQFLPEGTQLGDTRAVSRFMAAPWLWQQLQEARRVLIFQTDSTLCSKSEQRVEDYFEYDLVGAPIKRDIGEGYNGGLSLRNPRVFLNVTTSVEFATAGQDYEDQYFYSELKKAGAKLPSYDAAMAFAVETIFYEKPLGYHQPQRWQGEHMEEIEEWCPEVKMLAGRRAHW